MSEIRAKSCWRCAETYNGVIEVLLIMLLAFLPLAFGGVQAWGEEILFILVAAMSITLCLRNVLVSECRWVRSWIYLPPLVFLCIAMVQLIPLPTDLVSFLSPNTVKLRQELLGDLPNAEQLFESMKLSFYPHATWHDLRLLSALVILFIVVLNAFHSTRQIKRLLLAISIIGMVIAILALFQNVLGNGKIYWFITPPPRGAVLSGPFVNHSHFGQFMNLSIGAALGLLLVKIQEAFKEEVTPTTISRILGSRESTQLWLLVGIIILGVTTIFISLTRGGIISMLFATALTSMLLGIHKSIKGRGWIMGLMALGAFICVLYIGFDAVCDRLITLRDLETAEGGRWKLFRGTVLSCLQFPFLGSGLGTYSVVYPQFDITDSATLKTHAENEYAQVVAETGLLGLLVIIIFAGLICVKYIHCIKKTSTDTISLAAYGLGFGLFAIAIHSLSDFGQHIPANATLSSIFCALLIIIATGDSVHRKPGRVCRSTRLSITIRLLVMILFCLMWLLIVFEADQARYAAFCWNQVIDYKHQLMEKDWQGTEQEYIRLLTKAAEAANLQPKDIHYNQWLNVFRWRSITQFKDPNTGDIYLLPEAVGYAEQIVKEFHKIRQLCPTYGPTYSIAGQIELYVLDNHCGESHIKQGYRLAPCDPTVCFSAGLLEAHNDRPDEAFNHLSRAVTLDGYLYPEAIQICAIQLNRPDLALSLAQDNTGRLSTLAKLLAGDDNDHDIAKKARARVTELLTRRCEKSDASASVHASLAYIYAREGNFESAISHYRQALDLDYGKVNWRYDLAKALANIGAIPEAIREARVCLRLRPEFPQAQKLIEDLSIRAEAFD